MSDITLWKCTEHKISGLSIVK